MKKLLTLFVLLAIVAVTLASCAVVNDAIGLRTVTFDLNGGEAPEDFKDSIVVMDGKTAKLPTPTKENYTFEGWVTADGEMITEETPITASLDLIAKYHPNKVTITIVDEFGTVIPDVAFGEPLTAPTKEGYVFEGWFTADGTPVELGTVITENVELVAKWHPEKVTVTFLNHLGAVISTQTIGYGTDAVAPLIDEVVGDKKFDSWNASFTAVTADIIVSPIYVDNIYTITYDCGEIAASFTNTCFMGYLPQIPDAPVAEGYVFAGWYTDPYLTDRYFFDEKLDEDTTLYANFYDTTLGEYIVISNVDQLMAIKDDPAAKYLLACDINCRGEILAPIASFTGELDGNGYKIHNFTISSTASYVGFITTNSGTVSNLTFADFTYDILISTESSHYYGIIAATNKGTINNCHILDSTMKVQSTQSGFSTAYCYIGAIAGLNNGGVIDGCSNAAYLSITTRTNGGYDHWDNRTIYRNLRVGGLVGYGDNLSQLKNSANTGDMNVYVDVQWCDNAGGDRTTAYAHAYIGGVIGVSEGAVKNTSSDATITVYSEARSGYEYSYIYAGGFAGVINGEVTNCYSDGELLTQGDPYEAYIGGFVGRNTGKIYNSYSATDITDTANRSNRMGAFAGENILVSGYLATINKCFATGNISVKVVPGAVAHFVGYTTGTNVYCYYLAEATITTTVTETVTPEVAEGEEPGEPVEVEVTKDVDVTNEVGEAKAESELITRAFIADYLYFDQMIWWVFDGVLPTLR